MKQINIMNHLEEMCGADKFAIRISNLCFIDDFFTFMNGMQNQLERGGCTVSEVFAEVFLEGCFDILSKDIETIKTEMMHFSETAKEMRKKKEASEK